MIKCIAKKNLAFRNPANRDESVTVRPFEFATLPDWVEKDPMWGWALKDNLITVSKEVIVSKEEPKPEPKEEKPKKVVRKKKPVKKE
jgi:hypothetical protein